MAQDNLSTDPFLAKLGISLEDEERMVTLASEKLFDLIPGLCKKYPTLYEKGKMIEESYSGLVAKLVELSRKTQVTKLNELERRVQELEYIQSQSDSCYNWIISNTTDMYVARFYEVTNWSNTLENRYELEHSQRRVAGSIKRVFADLGGSLASHMEKTESEELMKQNVYKLVNAILAVVAKQIETDFSHDLSVSHILKHITMEQIDDKRNFFVTNDIIPDGGFVDKRMQPDGAKTRPTPISTPALAEGKPREPNQKGEVIWSKSEEGQIYSYLDTQIEDTKFDKSFGILFCRIGLQFYSVEKQHKGIVFKSSFYNWPDWRWVYILYSILRQMTHSTLKMGQFMNRDELIRFVHGTQLNVASIVAEGGSSITFAYWEGDEKEAEKHNHKMQRQSNIKRVKPNNEKKRCLKVYYNLACVGSALFDNSKRNEVEMYLALENKFKYMMHLHGVVTRNKIVYRKDFEQLRGIKGCDIVGIILPKLGKVLQWDLRRKSFASGIVRATDELNKLGYVHCDLRWNNILEVKDGQDFIAVLIDFQTCQQMSTTNLFFDVASLAKLFGVKNDYAPTSKLSPQNNRQAALNAVSMKIKNLIVSNKMFMPDGQKIGHTLKIRNKTKQQSNATAASNAAESNATTGNDVQMGST